MARPADWGTRESRYRAPGQARPSSIDLERRENHERRRKEQEALMRSTTTPRDCDDYWWGSGDDSEPVSPRPFVVDMSDNIDPDRYEVEEGAEVIGDVVLLPDDIDDEDDDEMAERIANLAKQIPTTGTVSTDPEDPPNRLPMKEF